MPHVIASPLPTAMCVLDDTGPDWPRGLTHWSTIQSVAPGGTFAGTSIRTVVRVDSRSCHGGSVDSVGWLSDPPSSAGTKRWVGDPV